MGTIKNAGFTIIETMLFLGITGLLIATMLVGVGTSINIQRYRDSVTSLENILQTQYSQVTNVDNGERTQAWSCDSTATITTSGGTDTAPRGQSDCIILGRYITTTSDQTLGIYSVVGYVNPATVLSNDDVTALQAYTINTSPLLSSSYSTEWGSTLITPVTHTPINFSILILRSPTSGIVRTFVNPTQSVAAGDLHTLIDPQYLATTSTATICVSSAATTLFTGLSAIRVNANAATSSGVEVVGDGSSGC
jgi:type II secretory pathway pseudopilin PulG